MATKSKQQKVPVLIVHSKRPSFRRAGIQFGSEPVTLVVADLTRDQLTAIKADPMLVAVESEAEAGEELDAA